MQPNPDDIPEDDWTGFKPDFGEWDLLCIEGMLCLWMLQEGLEELAGARIERLTKKIHTYASATVQADRQRRMEPSLN